MTPAGKCASPKRLSLHLNGSLPEVEEASIVGHLDTCHECQATLEGLATKGMTLLKTARAVGRDSYEPDATLSRVLAALDHPTLAPLDLHAPVAPIDLAGDAGLLELLEPDSHGYLGRIGHYAVTDVVARGGMGVVLKALDERLNRVVCLKFLAPQIAASSSARQRFVREARAAAAVRSDHVVTLHAVEEHRGLPYLVMDFVPGQTLQERLDREGPLPIDEVIRIGIEAASGLAAAHAQGLVHRDVKPANILWEQDSGRVRITDFGLARAVDDQSVTREDCIVGTPEYMSPEQARGEVVDHRSDLFSLGSVLYALCTGRPPFAAAGGALPTLLQVAKEQPLSVSELNREVSAGLAAVIDRLHAKDPADRLQSALDVVEALQSNDSRLVKPYAAHRMSAAQRRRPVWRTWASAAAVLLIAGTALAQIVIRIKGPGGETTEIKTAAGATVGIEKDGQQLASVTDDPSLRAALRLDGHRGPVWNAAFAGDRLLTAGEDSWVRVWDIGSGKEIQRFDGHTHVVYTLAVSPHGRLALSGSGCYILSKLEDVDWSVCLWEIETGRELQRLTGRGPGITSVAFSSDGQRALFGEYSGTVWLWDVPGWKQIRKFDFQHGLWSVCFSPDGTRALSSGGDNNQAVVRLWDLNDGKVVQRYEGHKFGAWHAIFLPGGRSILTGGLDETMRLWETDSGRQQDIFLTKGQVAKVATTKDGRFALAGVGRSGKEGNLRLWRLSSKQEVHAFPEQSTDLHAIALSPDGKMAVAGGYDGKVRVWKTPPEVLAAP
jgi:tRNA A-37 threonylcarbamoyl transferase component Bud32